VQAVSDRSGNVIVYAVTSCSDTFNPTFSIPVVLNTGQSRATVTLNRTRFKRVLPPQDEERIHAEYKTGASADHYYGANPGYYKSYAWGLDDACPQWGKAWSALTAAGFGPGLGRLDYRGYVLQGGPSVARFRSHTPINTYAETSVFPTAKGYGFPALPLGAHIGVDRILIRTATLP
jgi:hypothetical protein